MPQSTNETIRSFFAALDSRKISYCHWKSNQDINGILQGAGDIDLFVGAESVAAFSELLAEYNFREATPPPWTATPGVHHYFVIDPQTGAAIHLHIYYRIVTGGEFLKNYRLPVEGAILSETTVVRGVQLVTPPADLLLLTIRKALEHRNIFEFLMVRRAATEIRREIAALCGESPEDVISKAVTLGSLWFPNVSSDDLRAAIQTLSREPGSRESFLRCRRIYRSLQTHAIAPAWREFVVTTVRFSARLYCRFINPWRAKFTIADRGISVAFIGGDASGKSTIVDTITRDLGGDFRVRTIHSGKPPSTLVSALPNLLVRLARASLPQLRTTKVQLKGFESMSSYPSGAHGILLAVRALILAYDRKSLVSAEIRRNRREHTILISDRYPCSTLNAPDGPMIDIRNMESPSTFLRWLARFEHRIYSSIPPATVVIRLTVPVDVAVARNRVRNKVEAGGDAWIRFRHSQLDTAAFPESSYATVSTDQPLPAAVAQIKALIWSAL